MNQSLPKRCYWYGLTAIGLILFTLISPFFTVPVVVWLRSHHLYRKTITLIASPFFLSLLYYSWRRWAMIQSQRRLILILLSSVILYIAVYETVPDLGEKLHVLNFSVMAILIYKTFSPIMKLHWAFLLAWGLTSGISAVDEVLQRFIPGRDGSLHDVLIAVRSGLLGVIIAWVFDAYSRKGRS